MRLTITSGSRTQRAEWARHATTTISSAGHRASGPRAAVIEVLARQGCVRSAADISDELRAEGRGVGIATVYRALELMEGLGLLRRLDVGEGSARFEPALASGEHHHHVVCERCGRVGQFEDAELERAIHRVARRLSYSVGEHDVVLRGACPRCAGSAPRARVRRR